VATCTVVLPSAAGTSVPDGGCWLEAYTYDPAGRHYSLVRNDSVLVGQNLTVESNCGDIRVGINGPPSTGDVNSTSLELPLGFISTLNIEGEGWNLTYRNLTVYPGGQSGFFVRALGAGGATGFTLTHDELDDIRRASAVRAMGIALAFLIIAWFPAVSWVAANQKVKELTE